MPNVHIPSFEESQDSFFNPDVWCDESEAMHWVESWHQFPEWCSLFGRYEISSHGRIKSLFNGNKILKPFQPTRDPNSKFSLRYRLTLPLRRNVEVHPGALLEIAFGDELRAKGIEPIHEYPKSLILEELYLIDKRKRTKKIPDEDIREIRRLRDEEGMTYKDIGKKFGKTADRIRRICIRDVYASVE